MNDMLSFIWDSTVTVLVGGIGISIITLGFFILLSCIISLAVMILDSFMER